MKRHLTKSVYILACSAGVFFGCVNVFARESAMLKLPKREENGELELELELYFYLNTVNLSDKKKKITIYFNLYKHDLKI